VAYEGKKERVIINCRFQKAIKIVDIGVIRERTSDPKKKRARVVSRMLTIQKKRRGREGKIPK